MENNIYTKLAAAQKEMKQPVFDSENPHFKSKYASLASVMDSVLPALVKHGLFLSQGMADDVSGQIVINTVVYDGADYALLATFPIDISGMTAQQIGSAITYAKRYSLASAFARVADVDDDGNSASEPPKKRKAKQTAPKQPEVVIVDEHENAKQRLWIAVQKYAIANGMDARTTYTDIFAKRPVDEWSVEQLEDKAAEFEGAISE